MIGRSSCGCRASSLPLWIGVAGLDVVREPGGRFLVLDDNLRTPSGMAYTLAARETSLAAARTGRAAAPARRPRRLLMWSATPPPPRAARHWLLRAAVLTDGRGERGVLEHRRIAELLGVPLIEQEELNIDAVDVVYRRSDAGTGSTTTSGGCSRSRGSRAGSRLLNAFGDRVGYDKLAHAYVEDMVRYYLGWSCSWRWRQPTIGRRGARPGRRSTGSTSSLIKPRVGHGGEGVVICPMPSASTSSGSCASCSRRRRRTTSPEELVPSFLAT